jgi:hypothetical protein
MTTIADLPETKFEALLSELGLLGPLSIDGGTVPALTVQVGQYITQNLAKNERCLAIMASGSNNVGTSNRYDDTNMTVVISGKEDTADMIVVKMIANTFYQAFVDADRSASGDIMGLVPQGVTGPFYDDTGRVSYEVNTGVLLTRCS